MLTEMNGEPWNLTAQHQYRPPQVRGVYITLERQIKHGGTKGCAVCFANAKVHSPECRVRFQDIVDNEAAQTAAASASEPNIEMQELAAGGSAPNSSGGPVPAAGRPAPEDANMEAAESSTAQPTSPVVRTLEVEDDTRLIEGMPILHETDVDVNVDAHKLSCWRRCLTIKDSGLSGSSTGTRNTAEPRVGTCSIHRRCMKVD